MMEGPEGAIGAVVGRLVEQLPVVLAGLRARYGIDPDTDPYELPDVQTIKPFDKAALGLEEWPAVLVGSEGTKSMRLVENEADGEAWLVEYRLRVWVWCRDEDVERVQAQRNRLVLAVREALLAGRLLTPQVVVDDTSFEESLSSTEADDTGVPVAAAYTRLVVAAAEKRHVAPFGTLAGPVELDTGLVPPAS